MSKPLPVCLLTSPARFGRTPSRWQTHICQSIFQSLDDNNCLVEQSMEQLYSEALGKFLADRFVVGTCPKCKYEVGVGRYGVWCWGSAVQRGAWQFLSRVLWDVRVPQVQV